MYVSKNMTRTCDFFHQRMPVFLLSSPFLVCFSCVHKGKQNELSKDVLQIKMGIDRVVLWVEQVCLSINNTVDPLCKLCCESANNILKPRTVFCFQTLIAVSSTFHQDADEKGMIPLRA